jgi:hypothetical protein
VFQRGYRNEHYLIYMVIEINLSPLPGLCHRNIQPTAKAVGYCLPAAAAAQKLARLRSTSESLAATELFEPPQHK